MSKCTFALYLFFLLFSLKVYSQSKFKLEGFVLEADVNAPVLGASVTLENSPNGTLTEKNGRFSVTAMPGTYTIVITHLGYDTLRQSIHLRNNTSVNFYLKPRIGMMAEVKISADANNNTQNIQSNTLKISSKEIKLLPSFLGESNPLKIFQTLPGVGNGGEGNSGFYVRGGTNGQNLTLLNDATIYNPAHLLGFFSVFNGDAIDNVKLFKSGMPAEYGGRLASVLEAETGKHPIDSLTIKGNLNIISANATLEIPVNEHWSVSASARKTFLGLTVWPLLNRIRPDSKTLNRTKYDFYDVNLTSNIRWGKNNRVNFSAYHGGDDFGFRVANFNIHNSMGWQNSAYSLGWIKLIGDKISINNTLTYSNYHFNFGIAQDQYEAGISSKINDYGYKGSITLYQEKHQLKAGVEYIYHHFKPNTPFAVSSGTALDYGQPRTYFSDESAVFAGDEITFSNKLALYAGLRLTHYRHLGPYTISAEDQLTSMRYAKNQTISSYTYLEPRILANYKINGNSSLKFSFTKNIQPVHLISITAVNFPTDFWMPSIKNIAPERGYQASLGYFKNFNADQFESYVDVYYKSMDRLLEFSGGMMNLLDNLKIEDHLLHGSGNAYGSELYIKKKTGKLTGWVSYTLAWSNRKFPEINNGNPFPAKYDRRHDLSVVAMYKLSPKWTLSGLFTYATGNTYTKPLSRYIISGNIVNEYGAFNGERMPAYHRLDVAGNYTLKNAKKLKSELTFSVYNLYGRQNPLYIYFMPKGDLKKYQVAVEAKSVSLLSVLPSVGWRFSF